MYYYAFFSFSTVFMLCFVKLCKSFVKKATTIGAHGAQRTSSQRKSPWRGDSKVQLDTHTEKKWKKYEVIKQKYIDSFFSPFWPMPMPAPTLESGGSSEMPPTPVSYTFSLSSLCWPNFSWVGPFTVSSPLSFSLRVSYIKLQSTHKFTFNQHFSDLQSPTVPNTELVSVLAGNPNHTNREISACMSSFLDLWFGCLISRFILSHCICCRQRHQFKYDHIFQSYINIRTISPEGLLTQPTGISTRR